jgi:hypothetical protein
MAATAAGMAAGMAAGTAAATAAATAADADTAAATGAVMAAATAAAGEAASEFGGADAADAALVVIGAGGTAYGSGAITNPSMVRLDWGMPCSCAAHVVASRETLACELNGVLFAT